jgi:5-dehydro-2-deoxygluconokinase
VVERTYDVLAVGRSSIDLYANEIGVPFTDIKSFAAYVGGSPTNISVGTRRLGLRTALLNAVGDDLVGDFVQAFLHREGVDTRYGKRKLGRRTSAFLLGIEPPDRFPLVPYRDNCADLELTINDMLTAPIPESRLLLLSGTGLSREPSRDATLFAAEQAKEYGTTVVLDLDFRPELWADARTYGVAMRSILPLVDVVIGTLNEVEGALVRESNQELQGAYGDSVFAIDRNVAAELKFALDRGPEAIVVKRGAESTIVYSSGGEVIDVPTFPVEVYNVLGAGDAFASGLIYGYLRGWDWHRAARMGNACGAIVVTRHGCANFMPYEREALAFLDDRGGY